MHTFQNDTSRNNSSVVSRPRQSKWPAISMDDALAFIEKADVPVTMKHVPIAVAKVGQVLAERIVAKENVPEVRTSIKDGYAVLSSDPPGERKVIGTSTAGAPFMDTVTAGECVRISTGAAVPEGADAVAMVENTTLVEHDGVEELVINVNSAVKPGQDIRLPGSDVKKGDLLLDKGCVLGSAEIGILAGSGRRSVLMYKRPKVCVMSTGNELVECTAEEVPLGHIRDTNRPQLIALFTSHGIKAIDAGIAVDRRECLVEAIRVSFQYAHVIVTSGGVSMGERDLLKDVLVNDFGFEDKPDLQKFRRTLFTVGKVKMLKMGTSAGLVTILNFRKMSEVPQHFGLPVLTQDLMCFFLRRCLANDSTALSNMSFIGQRTVNEIHFGRVWMKPGLPTTFATGEICGDRKFVLALPGNPVSSWVAAQLFAVPLLKKAAGHTKIFQQEIKVKLGVDVKLDARPEYMRAWLQYESDIPTAITTGNQISSRLMSLSGANVLLKIPSKTDERTNLPAGTIVSALWLGAV